MSTNKFFYIPEWQTTATVSSPDAGFKKIYPKSTDNYWYVVDENGNEKKLEFAYYPKNGLIVTPYAITNPLGYQLDLSIGAGLTFAGNYVGSSVSVFGVLPYMLQSTGGATSGYILSTNGSSFVWSPFAFPGVSGSTNKIAKFDSSSSITDSLISDDGSNIFVGVTPSFITALVNIGGSVSVLGNLYPTDNNNVFLNYNNGWFFQTDQNYMFSHQSGYDYLILMTDNINTFTFSLLDGALYISDDGSYKFLESNINSANFGSTASALTFSIYSSNLGAIKIVDGSEGANKVLTSDASGVGTWQSLNSGDGINLNGLTISVGLTSTGLTISSNQLAFDYTIIGSSLTYSSGIIDLPATGITAGAYGGSGSTTALTVDSYGRITNISSFSLPIYDDYVNYPNDKGLTANAVSVDGGTASNTPITNTPIPGSYVAVYVNGQEYPVGNGTTNSSCYFGTNSTSPKGFSVSNAIQAGDYLYWNPSIAGFNLELGYRIAFHYLVTPASFGIYGFTGATGVAGPTGPVGTDVGNSSRWVYSNLGTAPMIDPGSTKFYSDNSSLSSVFSISVSKDNYLSVDYTAWLNELNTIWSGNNPVYLQITEVGNGVVSAVYDVLSVLDSVSYFDIYLNPVFSNGTFTDGVEYAISWIYSGLPGTNGIDGIDGGNSARFIFDSNIAPIDPGYQNFCVDIPLIGSMSLISISTYDYTFDDLYNWMSFLEQSIAAGRLVQLQITEVGNPYVGGIVEITSVTNNTTYFDLAIGQAFSGVGTVLTSPEIYSISYIVSGIQGSTGSTGHDAGNSSRWIYSNLSLSPGVDPGSTKFYSDNSTLGSVLSISLSNDNSDSVDFSAWLNEINTIWLGGNPVFLQITELGNSSITAVYDIISVVVTGTYVDIYLNAIVSNGSFTDGAEYTVSWVYSGLPGANGVDGVDGGNSVRLIFDSTVAPIDPGLQNFCADNSMVSSMTVLSLSTTDYTYDDLYTWLNYLNLAIASGRQVLLQIGEVGNPYTGAILELSSITDNTTYFDLGIGQVITGSSSVFIPSEIYSLSYVISGSIGLTGSVGATGATGSTGNDASNSSRWLWSNAAVAGSDPGSSNFYSDVTTLASISFISISKDNVNVIDYYAWFNEINVLISGGNPVLLTITEVGNSVISCIYDVTFVVDNGTYFDVYLAPSVGNGSLNNGSEYSISWIYSGAPGTNGSDGTHGSNTVTFIYDAIAAPIDPGFQKFCSDNTLFGSIATFSISTTEIFYQNVYDWLDYMNTAITAGKKPLLQITQIGSPFVSAILEISTIVDNSTFFDLGVSQILAGASFILIPSETYTISYVSDGVNGTDAANSARWIMSTASVPSADPGSTYFYVDNTSLASLGSISISKDDENNTDLYAWLSQLYSIYFGGNPVFVQITEVGNPSVSAYLVIGSMVDYTTYFDLSFASILGTGTFTNGKVYTISWIYAGTNGADGVDGSNSSRWQFTSTAAPADPGTNLFCTNDANFITMTDISISTTDYFGNSLYDWLKYIETSRNSGRDVTLQLTEIGNPSVMGVVQIATATDNGTYFDFTVGSLLAGAAVALNDTKVYTISYTVGGAAGATGATSYGSLQDTLGVGNTMGTYSIITDSGKIQSTGGTTSIALSDSTFNIVTPQIEFNIPNNGWGYPEIRNIFETFTTGTVSATVSTITNSNFPNESVMTLQVIIQAVDPTNALYYSNNIFAFFWITGGVVSLIGTPTIDERTNMGTYSVSVNTDATDVYVTVQGDTGSSVYWVIRWIYQISTAV